LKKATSGSCNSKPSPPQIQKTDRKEDVRAGYQKGVALRLSEKKMVARRGKNQKKRKDSRDTDATRFRALFAGNKRRQKGRSPNSHQDEIEVGEKKKRSRGEGFKLRNHRKGTEEGKRRKEKPPNVLTTQGNKRRRAKGREFRIRHNTQIEELQRKEEKGEKEGFERRPVNWLPRQGIRKKSRLKRLRGRRGQSHPRLGKGKMGGGRSGCGGCDERKAFSKLTKTTRGGR